MAMILEVQTVAVYCTEQKKLVMLFSSITKADKYIFNPLKYSVGRSRYLIQNKGKTNKNLFNKSLAFRSVTKEQKEILGEHEIVILDPSFVREEYRGMLSLNISANK